jgi:hypothetical protein
VWANNPASQDKQAKRPASCGAGFFICACLSYAASGGKSIGKGGRKENMNRQKDGQAHQSYLTEPRQNASGQTTNNLKHEPKSTQKGRKRSLTGIQHGFVKEIAPMKNIKCKEELMVGKRCPKGTGFSDPLDLLMALVNLADSMQAIGTLAAFGYITINDSPLSSSLLKAEEEMRKMLEDGLKMLEEDGGIECDFSPCPGCDLINCGECESVQD